MSGDNCSFLLLFFFFFASSFPTATHHDQEDVKRAAEAENGGSSTKEYETYEIHGHTIDAEREKETQKAEEVAWKTEQEQLLIRDDLIILNSKVEQTNGSVKVRGSFSSSSSSFYDDDERCLMRMCLIKFFFFFFFSLVSSSLFSVFSVFSLSRSLSFRRSLHLLSCSFSPPLIHSSLPPPPSKQKQQKPKQDAWTIIDYNRALDLLSRGRSVDIMNENDIYHTNIAPIARKTMHAITEYEEAEAERRAAAIMQVSLEVCVCVCDFWSFEKSHVFLIFYSSLFSGA